MIAAFIEGRRSIRYSSTDADAVENFVKGRLGDVLAGVVSVPPETVEEEEAEEVEKAEEEGESTEDEGGR